MQRAKQVRVHDSSRAAEALEAEGGNLHVLRKYQFKTSEIIHATDAVFKVTITLKHKQNQSLPSLQHKSTEDLRSMEISPGEGAAITLGRPFAGLAPNNTARYYKQPQCS